MTITHVLSVEILRVALNAFASQAILEMENLAAFLVRKKINTSGKIKFYLETQDFHYYIITVESLCNSTCEQHCYRSRDGTYNCTCDRGYYLAADHTSCIGKCSFLIKCLCQSHNNADINECLVRNFDGCPQDRSQCNNTVGSFVCICNHGYLSDGENNCVGIKKFVAIIYIID